MGDEHLDTIPATKSVEFIKSCVENLVPNPSESKGENGCDVPAGFTTFSNVLFNADYDSDSGNDQSTSDEDFSKKIYSNPLFDEEIIPMEIDSHFFNVESDLIGSMPNHDSSITISSKIDYLFDEFASELTLLKSIPPGIDETDCQPEEEIRLTKRLLYDNSSPRPPKEIVSDNSNADIESFSPSPIPNEDSDSRMEEIDLPFTPDDPMPPGIEDDDYDSGRDIPILEKLLDNYSLSLPANESYYFDIPSPYRPPAKPPDGNTGTLNIKMMGDVSNLKVPIPNLTTTCILNQEKSPDLLSHLGLEIFQPSAECPMIINGKNTPILDVPLACALVLLLISMLNLLLIYQLPIQSVVTVDVQSNLLLDESPVYTMADRRTMAELLRAPPEGYAEAIVVPPILAEQFELKHRAARRWFEKEPPFSILTWEDLVSKFINEFFPSSRTTNLRNEISNFQQRFDESFHEAWDRYKDLLCACPHHGFIELHQIDTFYNALNPADQDSLNSAAGGNLLERRTQDVLTIIENKSKVRNSRNKSVVSQVKSSDANSNSEIAKLTHAVNQQTSAVTTAITAILQQFQATSPPASVKAVEEICVTCGGAHPYYQCLAADGNTFSELRDNIQGYVAAAAINYNHGISCYRPPGVANQIRSPGFAQPNGELKAITTQSGIVLDGPSVLIPPLFINPDEDERVEETLTDHDLADSAFQQGETFRTGNTPLNENFSTVILKKLPEKLGDLRKFLIPCGFSEFKCKALVDLGASINLMPLSVWKKLGLPELISTRMTLELANRAICTLTRIARDVFILVGKFTFPAYFSIVDYESDPRVPLILGRPFLWTARALIDVHREKMILRDSDERLTLNMRYDTSSYSNQPQKESINLINVFNDSGGDFLKKMFSTNHQSGNPTFSSHPILTSSEVKYDIFDLDGGNVLPDTLLDLDSTKDLHPPHHVNPLSGSTTSFSPNHLLEEFADELALITFPPRNDDLPFDNEFDLKEIEHLLHLDHIKDMNSILRDLVDQSNLADLNDNLVDTMLEMFTDEHAFDYSSPSLYDEYDDDLFEVESDTKYVYDDPFDSKGEKIKESKLLIDEIDLPSDFLPSFEYDLFFSEDFFEVDALPLTNNEEKLFNPGILIQENLFEVITRVAPEKNEKRLAIYHASLILKDFDPPLYELPFFKEVPGAETPLSFSSKNEGKVFKPGILTSKEVHSSLIPELSHQGYKVF
uniref:Reverse transcriptase domain-containing protein n=1 Tax=Tanacetum cinerariifolium TaxID=118510 RepID=A0A6L2J310_TANCI|nr:reverse transcriptase domain-containing protein [Tanacetum cinerariifolium]